MLLAFLHGEPGGDTVQPLLSGAAISAVNWSEVLQRPRHVETAGLLEDLVALRLEIVSFDADQAETAAGLWTSIHRKGLSLGDRACLALALCDLNATICTMGGWARGGDMRAGRMATSVAALILLLISVLWAVPVRADEDTGIVQGTVTISPCRPVERPDDPPCPPAANVTLQFQGLDEPDSIFTTTTDANGWYQIGLPEGTYQVTLRESSINKTPQEVTVTAGETTTADLMFDTGIR